MIYTQNTPKSVIEAVKQIINNIDTDIVNDNDTTSYLFIQLVLI